jgi:hypothetical protein
MRELWDRFGPWLMIAVVAVGFLRVVWGRDSFCGPETEHCFREWVSALGGWAAVAAAIPTVYYLSKQISDMKEQNIYERWSQRTARMSLCKAATNICKEIEIHINTSQDGIDKGTKREQLFLLGTVLKGLQELFEREALHRFEMEIGPPRTLGAKFIADAAKSAHEYHLLIRDKPEVLASKGLEEGLTHLKDFLLPSTLEYIARLKELAKQFEEESDAILQTK